MEAPAGSRPEVGPEVGLTRQLHVEEVRCAILGGEHQGVYASRAVPDALQQKVHDVAVGRDVGLDPDQQGVEHAGEGGGETRHGPHERHKGAEPVGCKQQDQARCQKRKGGALDALGHAGLHAGVRGEHVEIEGRGDENQAGHVRYDHPLEDGGEGRLRCLLLGFRYTVGLGTRWSELAAFLDTPAPAGEPRDALFVATAAARLGR